MDQDQYPINVDGWFASGWHTFRKRAGTLFSGVAVLFLYFILLTGAGSLPGGDAVVILLQLTVGLALSAGWLLFCLRLVRGEETGASDMFEPFRRFGAVWGVSIWVSLLVAGGLFLFVIPGVYLMLRYGLAVFACVDGKLSPGESMRLSSDITSGHRWQLLVLYGIMIGLYGLSVFPYIVDLGGLGALTVPVYNFILTPLLGTAYASAYDSLVSTGEEGAG